MADRRILLTAAVVAVAAAGTFVYLQRTMPAWYARLWYPLHYSTIVRQHAEVDNLDPSLLAAVIEAESKFDPNARSSAGAIGLMQLTPQTAKEAWAAESAGTPFRVSDLTDPEVNVRYGAWYLRQLLDKYGDERLALAAYNAGESNVDRWQKAHEPIQFSETRAYVARVEWLKTIYRRAYAAQLGY